MTRYVIALIGLVSVSAYSAETPVAGDPAAITSVMIPPTVERSVAFVDRGRTYLIGTVSGKVTVVEAATPLPPVPPPTPSYPLTGLSRQVYDGVMSLPIDAGKRKLGALALLGAIDSTLSEAGGLGVNDPQVIINTLGKNAELAQVNVLLQGFRLGDLLTGNSVTTKDLLVKALEDVKSGLGAVK